MDAGAMILTFVYMFRQVQEIALSAISNTFYK